MVGQIPTRNGRTKGTLAAFLDSYIEKRIHVKGDAKVVWGHTKRNLLAFFGENKILRGIMPGDAEDFRLYLVGQGLSATTIHKRMQVARTFFRAAAKHRLIDRNPLKGVKAPAVPRVAGEPGDGACVGVPRPVRHGLAGQYAENRTEALRDGDGGTLREGHNRRRRGGAKCGALRARTGQ